MYSTARFLTTASLLVLCSCASIIEGSTDNINVTTSPAMRATCTLTNSRGTYNTYAPASTAVKKSRTDMNISCIDQQTGATGQTKMASDVEPWAFGNILWVVYAPVALATDWITGAAYDYPASAVVSMRMPTGYSTAPQEIYQPAAAESAISQSGLATSPAATTYATQPAFTTVTQQPAPVAAYPTQPQAPSPAQQEVPLANPHYEYIPPSQLGVPQR